MQTRFGRLTNLLLSVPVRIKVLGIMVFPVVLMGLALNYWVQTGLSDWLSYVLSDQRVAAAMDAGSRSVLLVSVLVASISILLTSFLMYILTQPLLELRKTAIRVAKGELESRARSWSADEIGDLANSVNQMIDKLVANQSDLERRNRELQALNQVSMTVTQNEEIHDVLYRILAGVLNILEIEMGWIYLYNPDSHQFHLATWFGVEDDLKQALLEPEPLCECQIAISEGKPFPNRVLATCARMRQINLSHRAIPLVRKGGAPLGLMLLACTHPREFLAEEQELLDLIGAQVSEIVSNAWLQLKLSEKEIARQRLLESLVTAQEDERSRLARELHDGAGQTLTTLLVRMKMLENQVGDEKLRTKLADLCTLVSGSIEYVRALSHQMRPAVLEEIGLEQAVRNLAENCAHEGALNYSVDLNLGAVRLPNALETTIYRIIQEGLTNVMRHSGADRFRVGLYRENGSIVVEVEDNGAGFDPNEASPKGSGRHLGIRGMQERVALLSGVLTVTSEKGTGTCIRGELPLVEVGDLGGAA